MPTLIGSRCSSTRFHEQQKVHVSGGLLDMPHRCISRLGLKWNGWLSNLLALFIVKVGLSVPAQEKMTKFYLTHPCTVYPALRGRVGLQFPKLPLCYTSELAISSSEQGKCSDSRNSIFFFFLFTQSRKDAPLPSQSFTLTKPPNQPDIAMSSLHKLGKTNCYKMFF